MSVPRPPDLDRAIRQYYIGDAGVPQETTAAITAQTPANGSIFEINYLGREGGAVQVFSMDGGAVSATFKVQGTLKGGTFRNMGAGGSGWSTPTLDTDYVDIATITNTGVAQIPAGQVFSRVRVICTAYTSGQPGVRIV